MKDHGVGALVRRFLLCRRTLTSWQQRTPHDQVAKAYRPSKAQDTLHEVGCSTHYSTNPVSRDKELEDICAY